MDEGKLPLGLCRQVAMKLDSAMTDLHEICDDPDIEAVDKESFQRMTSILSDMLTMLVCVVSKEIDEEEFLGETPDMDEIEPYPGTAENILDEKI